MSRLVVDAYDLLGRVQMFVGERAVVTVHCVSAKISRSDCRNEPGLRNRSLVCVCVCEVR